jgi:cell division septum initiation protein DivIVA
MNAPQNATRKPINTKRRPGLASPRSARFDGEGPHSAAGTLDANLPSKADFETSDPEKRSRNVKGKHLAASTPPNVSAPTDAKAVAESRPQRPSPRPFDRLKKSHDDAALPKHDVGCAGGITYDDVCQELARVSQNAQDFRAQYTQDFQSFRDNIAKFRGDMDQSTAEVRERLRVTHDRFTQQFKNQQANLDRLVQNVHAWDATFKELAQQNAEWEAEAKQRAAQPGRKVADELLAMRCPER